MSDDDVIIEDGASSWTPFLSTNVALEATSFPGHQLPKVVNIS